MRILKTRLARSVCWPHFLSSLVLLFFFRDLLIWQTTAVIHDSLKIYPFFHYLVQNLQNDVFPVWSPQGHCGEPFWPYILFTGLLQPVAVLVMAVGWLTQTREISLLFHWFLFLSVLIFNWGIVALVNWVFRDSPRRLALNWVVSPIIFLGTFSTVVWAQAFGTVLIATYFPWCVYLLCRTLDFLEKQDLKKAYTTAFYLVILITVHFTSYNPGFFCFAFLAQTIPLLLHSWRRSGFTAWYATNSVRLGMLVGILVFVFSGPTWVLAKTQALLAPIARQDDSQYYSRTATYNAGFAAANATIQGDLGDSALPGDIFQALQLSEPWDHKELPLLVGLAGFVLLLVGMLRFKHGVPLNFGLPLLFFILVSLGDRIGLSTHLYNWLPGFILVRHLQFFLSFAFLGAIVCAANGADLVLGVLTTRRAVAGLVLIVAFCSILEFRRNKTKNLQQTPEILKVDFGYLGKSFSWRRRFVSQPVRPLAFYRDHTRSQGEPFLLYQDTVRFVGRQGPKFFAPLDYWRALESQKMTLDMLGVSADKLRLINGNGTVQLIEYDPNGLKVRTDATEPHVLFYSQNRFPGWRAVLDGKEVPIPHLPNHTFFEFPIPGGQHELVLRYRPTWFLVSLGLYLSLFVMGGLVALKLPLKGHLRHHKLAPLRPQALGA